MNVQFLLVLIVYVTYGFDFLNCFRKDTEETNRKSAKNVFEFPDRPLQLVKPDLLHKRLVIVEENLKLLHNLEGSVATVAVVGKFHSGKSFLMNQLMGKSKGFGVGPSVKPETMGIWMWGQPVQMVLSSGKKVSIIFLDTEGFAANNVSENYDAKIFAVATLISSHLLYNSVKIIDQADIDYLELLARRTQLFALRSQMSRAKWTNDFIHDLLTFPPLIWVVQDFVQSTLDGESTKQWLHRLMESHTRENEDYEISLLSIFNSVDCHTLFLPAVKKRLLMDLSLADEEDLTEEYIEERNDLITKLKKNIVPKEKNHRSITGRELAGLFEILVNAANDGSLSEVPSRWNVFIDRLKQTATEDCLGFYEMEMAALDTKHNGGPVKVLQLEEWSSQAQSQAIQLLGHLLQGLEEAKEESQQKLTKKIVLIYQRTKDMNEKKIRLKCSELQSKFELKSEEILRAVQLPLSTKKLEEIFQNTARTIQRDFLVELDGIVSLEEQEKYSTSLKHSVSVLGGSIALQNSKAIEEVFKDGVNEAIDVFKKATRNVDRLPRKPEFLATIIENGFQESEKCFNKHGAEYANETMFIPFKALLQTEITKNVQILEKENEELVRTIASQIVKDLTIQFKQNTDSLKISLPMNETDLQSRLEIEGSRTIRECQEKMGEFSKYPIYKTTINQLKDGIQIVIVQRNDENVEAFKREVEKPLHTAKQIILLSAEKYNTVFGLKQYMSKLSLLQLNDGKPKHWSLELKSNIIESFIEKDKDLRSLLQDREGIWSSIVGFFEWILCFLGL